MRGSSRVMTVKRKILGQRGGHAQAFRRTAARYASRYSAPRALQHRQAYTARCVFRTVGASRSSAAKCDASPTAAIGLSTGESRVGSTKAAGPCAQERDLATPKPPAPAPQAKPTPLPRPTPPASPRPPAEEKRRPEAPASPPVSTGESGSASRRAIPSAGRRGTSVRSTPWGQHAPNANGSCAASSAEDTAGA